MERIITKSFARLMGRGTHRGFITYEELSKSLGKRNLSDENLAKIINRVLSDHPKQVEQFLAGKKKVFGFLVGQVMKVSAGKANPKIVSKLIEEKLNQ